ncbi:uncharacterized protein [Montipora foliosa]|uniref:uncharacterized protein isoform X2 n=1 Tax=Montipora foliosa TaxID=591990 RepID=UPI0035F1E93B
MPPVGCIRLYMRQCLNGNRERCGDIFRAHLRLVKGNGITPFVVFDGLPLPAKASEDERRQRDRENLESKAEDRNISVEDATKLRSQALKTFTTTEDDEGVHGQERGSAESASEFHGDGNWCQAMTCEIIQIDRFFSFSWRIPCFPVMEIEFVKVCFKKGSDILNGVVQKGAAGDIQRGAYKCNSHCQIQVGGKPYTVLWTLIPVQKADHAAPPVSETTVSDSDTSDNNVDCDEPNDIVTTHCLPFEVMGTCYSKAGQDSLQEAFQYLNEHNRPVYAKLQAEPENTNDKSAIAVYLMSSSDYEKVGYIASELTRYLHPLLKNLSLLVSVKKNSFLYNFPYDWFLFNDRYYQERPVREPSNQS